MPRLPPWALRRPRPVGWHCSGVWALSNLSSPPKRRGTPQVRCQECQSSIKALCLVGAPKSPAPLIEGAGTSLRPGNHLANIANLLPRRKTYFSERRSSACTSTGAKNKWGLTSSNDNLQPSNNSDTPKGWCKPPKFTTSCNADISIMIDNHQTWYILPVTHCGVWYISSSRLWAISLKENFLNRKFPFWEDL
jgi:hypothetical protein